MITCGVAEVLGDHSGTCTKGQRGLWLEGQCVGSSRCPCPGSLCWVLAGHAPSHLFTSILHLFVPHAWWSKLIMGEFL